MARFVVEVKFEADDFNSASSLCGLLFGHTLHRANFWGERRFSVSVPIVQPDPVDSHGKHGMADGVGGGCVCGEPECNTITSGACLAGARPFTVGQPKKRPATCSCYMGASAQPYAHEPSCPVHPRYVDTELSSVDRSPD